MRALQVILGLRIYRCLLHSSMAVVSLALVATVLPAGCATAPTKSEPLLDPQANFGAYKTFGWHTEASANGSTEPVSIVDASIRAAIASEMQRKGYAEAPAGSAC